MSEPSSFLLKCQISRSALHQFMASPIMPFDTYSDWDTISFEILDEELRFVRSLEGKQTWNWLRPQFLGDEVVHRFHHHENTDTLVYCNMLLSESWSFFLPFLHVIRGIGAFLAQDGGYAIIHNYIYAPTLTQALITFSGKSSTLVDVDSFTPEIDSYVKDASTVFSEMVSQSDKKYDLGEPYDAFYEFDQYKPG
ncbi:hypothetical protein [Roseibium sediminis]|uniref:hypothetical protein n=1 Tax=Roseibium sediminis TaxID=1775174 RepID=UPI00123DCBE4|nr:hypothetical protein [Roseibium sediminis]